MVLYLDALVLIVGLLMYLLASKPGVAEIGRLMFFAGLLALLLGSDKVSGVLHG